MTSPPHDNRPRRWASGETLLIFALFFLLAAAPPPDVNEVHYLAKAKHYWNPSWCAGDLFLESADAHLVFCWVFGWLTLFLPLSAVAWIGRLVTWGLLAWSWRRLSVAVVPRRLFAVLTAGLFCWLLACFHLSGEWVLGGLEAKGVAQALLLCALEALVRGRWSRVWLLLGASSAFHVLVGGWSVIVAGFVWALSGRDRPGLKSMLPSLAGGLLLALPGLLPALTLTWGTDADVVQEANRIYVLERLKHHLSFHGILLQPLTLDFRYLGIPTLRLGLPRLFFARHLVLLVGWLVLMWRLQSQGGQRRLSYFVAGACLIAAGGIVIDQLTLGQPEIAAAWLRYYWFRLSDVMLPLGTALGVGQWIDRLQQNSSPAAHGWIVACSLLITLHVTDAFFRHRHDPRPAAVQQAHPRDEHADGRLAAWRDACREIAATTRPGEVLLTPRYQQTFKWYAHRGEVANWKDVPQDANAIVQWHRRMRELYPREVEARGLVAHGEDRLLQLARTYGFRYVVLDRTRSDRALTFQRVYPAPGRRSAYEVYRLPTGESQDVPP